MNGNLSLLKIISGLSRTISIANKMLPLYNQIKPIIANGNKLLSNISIPQTSSNKSSSNNGSIVVEQVTKKSTSNSLPTFFQ